MIKTNTDNYDAYESISDIIRLLPYQIYWKKKVFKW